jgi:hypothetical protein
MACMKNSVKLTKSRKDDLFKLIATAVGMTAVIWAFGAFSGRGSLRDSLVFYLCSLVGLSFMGAVIYGAVKVTARGRSRERALLRLCFSLLAFGLVTYGMLYLVVTYF